MSIDANQKLINRDLNVLWHPCTQMKDHEKIPLIPVKKAKGIYLEDFMGNKYIDAISSWWVNIFGHANPRINQAITEQLNTLEHVMLAGFSHEPAVSLAERLIELAPPSLTKVFYADNGSSAIEAALKMSFHYWQNIGETRKNKFIYLANSYHGETLGAMSVSGVALYKETYKPLLLDFIEVPSPDCFYREEGESWQEYSKRQFAYMREAIKENSSETCAVIIEPLVQCAGSMRMYHEEYLRMLRQTCNKYGVHLIADEIAVGFGRTGTMFACEQANISPDFLCLSKGITAGYLPLSTVLTTNEIYQAFYDDYSSLKAFLHSHSYTGNPLACRAALATLDIFREDNTIVSNKELINHIQKITEKFKEHPNVAEVRQQGMICAIEMVKDKKSKIPYPWQERRGLRVFRHAMTKGVLLRPLGNVIYFMPPYVINKQELDKLAAVALEGIEIATKD